MLFLWYFSVIICIFSHFSAVNCLLMSLCLSLICSPHKSECFCFADSLPLRDGFCQPTADKCPSNFSACYNCFFSLIPLKWYCSTGGKLR